MTRIEFLRKEIELTQSQFARQIGESQCNISQIERGIRKPWPRVRKAISDALGVSEVDLFDPKGSPLLVDWQLPRRKEVV